MFEALVAALDIEKSTLIFTNTRNQAERWFQALSFALPTMPTKLPCTMGPLT
jgi:ATP-dependent Lhr-like helicase